MKKTLFFVLIAFIALFAMATSVQATGETTVTDGATLKTALESGESVILSNDITDLTGTIQISDSITIDGAGNSIEVSTFKKVFVLNEGANVTFKDITIKNTFGDGRCIDIQYGNTELELIGVTLETTTTASGNGHDRPLNVGGNFSEAINITITDSNIKAGESGYAIMTFNPINLTIDNSEVTGYTALYLKGPNSSAGSAGSVINIKNGSVLHGKNVHSGETNAFGTIVMEDGNITINVVDSELKATGEGDQIQFVFDENRTQGASEDDSKIEVEGTSTITSTNVAENDLVETTIGQFGSNTSVVVETGVTSNVEIPTEYLPENVEIKDLGNGKFEVVVTTYKVTIDGTEYTVETGKTVKDISRYNSIITKEGYNFVEFQTEDGEKWVETTEIESDIVLKTVFEEVVEEDEEDDNLNVEDEGKNEEQKDETPKTGVESLTFTVFATIAVISLLGIVVTRKRK